MLVAELNKTRKLGCEYECAVPLIGTGSGRDVQETLARVLTANGIRAIARGYDHSLLPPGVDVAVEYDSSVQGESRWAGVQWMPIELKTRIMTYPEWEDVVPKTLEIVKYMGGQAGSPTCGHHVHLAFDEVRSDPRTVRSLWNVVHRFENVIYGLVAPSRRNSHYCKPLPPQAAKLLNGTNTLRGLRRALAEYDRYHGLNLVHIFDAQPHIEFRYHGGTLDATKARHWLRFCLQVLQHSCDRRCQATDTPATNDRRGIEALLVVTGMKPNSRVYKVGQELRETGRYLLKRWKAFNGDVPLKVASARKKLTEAEGVN